MQDSNARGFKLQWYIGLKPVVHLVTFSLATFAKQSVKLPLSCRGKEVGKNWGGYLKK